MKTFNRNNSKLVIIKIMGEKLGFCLTLIIIALASEVKANSDSIPVSKYLTFKTGLYNMASIDKLYSPFSYSGRSGTFGIGWGRKKTNSSYETNFIISNIRREAKSLNGIPNTYPNNHYHIVKNSYVFEVMDYYRFLFQNNFQKEIQTYFSGLWFTSGSITTNSMGIPEFFQTGLAPGIMLSKKKGYHTLRTEIHMPLITITVRNNYSMSMAQTYEELSKLAFIRQNMMLQTPFSSLAFLCDISYEYRISKSFSLKGNFNFRYLKNTKPQTLELVSNVYMLSIIYNR